MHHQLGTLFLSVEICETWHALSVNDGTEKIFSMRKYVQCLNCQCGRGVPCNGLPHAVACPWHGELNLNVGNVPAAYCMADTQALWGDVRYQRA